MCTVLHIQLWVSVSSHLPNRCPTTLNSYKFQSPLCSTYFYHWFSVTKHLLSNLEGLGSLHGVEVVEAIGKIYMAVVFFFL